MQLTDGGGHALRVAIAREFYEAGFNAEAIAKLFKGQNDYDFDYSLKMVYSVINRPGKRVRCDTLQQNSSKFVKCEGCEYLGRW
jgi:hypothetical protein